MKLITTLIMFTSLLANAEVYNLNPGQIKFTPPKGWEETSGLFGVQLMLAGPVKEKSRPIITVESTHITQELNTKELSSDDGTYRIGRLRWLTKNAGKSHSFLPYKAIIRKGKLTDHIVGHEYEVAGISYYEESHYIKCQDILFNIKALIPLKQKREILPQVDSLFSSFECLKGKSL